MIMYLNAPVVYEISDVDVNRVLSFNFSLQDVYLRCWANPYRGWFLHQMVIEWMGLILKPNEMVDHKDLNTFNNKRDNLRIATATQNNANKLLYSNNTSGEKGVDFYPRYNMYRARISVGGKLKTICYGPEAYCIERFEEAARKRDGEFYNKGY